MKKINLPMQLRELMVAPATINREERTFDVICTTDAPCERWGYFEILEISEDAIDLSRFQNGAPVIDSHNSHETKSVVGVIEKSWLEDGQLMATVRIAKGDELADRLWLKIDQGILRFVSIGYSIQEYSESIENDVRTLRATKWTPLELSIVAVPADSNAQMRSPAGSFQCVIKSSKEQPKEHVLKKNKKREAGEEITLQTIFDWLQAFKDEINGRLDALEAATAADDDDDDGDGDGAPSDDGEDRDDDEDDPDGEHADDDEPEDKKSARQAPRMAQILNLASVAGLSAAETRAYVRSKKTVRQVQDELAAKRAAESSDVRTKSNLPSDAAKKSLLARAKERFTTKK
jgi:phage head maturation protease